MKSAIVVGAGFAGLACALELARNGVSVDVFETALSPGGRASTIASPDGRFRFDAGPTLLTMTDVVRRALGDSAFAALHLRRLEPGYRVMWPTGERFDQHSDVALWLREIEHFQGPGGDADALAYLARVHEQLRESRRKILDVRMDARALLRAFLTPGKLRPWVFGDLRKFTSHYFSHARIIQALCFQTLYLGLSPLRSPALYALLAVSEIVDGVWHLRGGIAALVAAFVRECERFGVRFHYGAPVSLLTVSNGRARGAVVGTHVHRADAFVLALDRERAITQLLQRRARRRLRYGHSATVYYLGIDGPVDLPHHSVFLPADPWRAYAELDDGDIPNDPMLYVCNAPDSGGISVLLPCPNTSVPTEPAAHYERALATVERHAGPLRERVVFRATRGPREFERDLNLAHGAAFGPAHTLAQMGPLRPGIADWEARNLAFAGSGTHPGSGVPMVLISGRLAAEHLLEQLA